MRALKLHDVAVAGVDRMVLTEQIAVMDLIALGRFVLLPTDDLTLATVLKSPLIGLSEEDLFRLAHPRPGSLWDALRAPTGDARLVAAQEFLAEMLTLADQVPPFEFYSHVLGPLGGRRRFFGRLGPEADDPVVEFLDLAMHYERTSPPSLEGFLAWLETSAVEIKRDFEQANRDAVRVMTIHGAKGLQAPIVFLPDTMRVPRVHNPDRPPPIFWVRDETGASAPLPLWGPSAEAREERTEAALALRKEGMMQEYRRLLYVAMTRAEDQLIVCGWRGKQNRAEGCWYQLVADALDPATAPVEILESFDPYLDSAKNAGDFDADPIVRRIVSTQIDQPGAEEEREVPLSIPLPEWATSEPKSAEFVARPLAPSRIGREDDPPLQRPLAGSGGGGYRRGRIIHRLLQSVPDMPMASRDDSVRHWLARQARGLSVSDQDDISRQVLAIVSHPAFAHVFGPDSLAEVPLSGSLNGRLLSGRSTVWW
ncbi:MAG: hypothetical protein HC826_02295 [Rhodospirillales bacterium]|nr:hypothetical protein [Rhodospirillales bacterium]